MTAPTQPDDTTLGPLVDVMLAIDALLAAGHIGQARVELARALALLENEVVP
jgi:hypothetical protein